VAIVRELGDDMASRRNDTQLNCTALAALAEVLA
jgi:hypothetical protein